MQMAWMAPSSLTLRRKERESDMALSHSSQATHLVLSFSPSFVVLFYFRFVVLLLSFRRFVAFGFVVLYQKQIREPRGALLFALKEETCDRINCCRFLLPNNLENRIILFYLPAQEIRNPLSRRHV